MFDLYIAGDSVYQECWSSARTARSRALVLANRFSLPIEVKAGGKTRYVVSPEGRVSSPDHAEVPERAACTRDDGRSCFCPPCRAARREERT